MCLAAPSSLARASIRARSSRVKPPVSTVTDDPGLLLAREARDEEARVEPARVGDDDGRRCHPSLLEGADPNSRALVARALRLDPALDLAGARVVGRELEELLEVRDRARRVGPDSEEAARLPDLGVLGGDLDRPVAVGG